MTLEYKTTDQLAALIAEAREKEASATAALMVDGRRMYAPEEHEKRVAAIETERRQTISAVTAETQRRLNEIDEQLLPTDADPVAALPTDALTRAAALAPFVREDVAAGNFTAKLRAVVKSGDAASRAVWFRTIAALDKDARRGWDSETHDLVQKLEKIVRPHDPRQDELRTRQEALNRVLLNEATSSYMQRVYGRR